MPNCFRPVRNPTDDVLASLIRSSDHEAARRIIDPRNGAIWYWRAEEATHAEGAAALGVPYDRPPGAGDVVTL